MKHFKQESTLIRLDEFRIFFQEDVMFAVSGKPFYYHSMNALSDWEAILGARTMFPRLTVRCVMKLHISSWIEVV